MKKISHLAILSILLASSAIPLFVMADPAGTANGSYCTLSSGASGLMLNGTCVSPSNYPSQSLGGSPSSGGINIGVIKPYSDSITGIINGIFVPVLMAIAFIVFLWGVFKYFILGASDEKNRTDGRQFVLWGIIGFVIILSVWGLVNIVTSALNLSSGTHPVPPQI
jgi:hypothetical protein